MSEFTNRKLNMHWSFETYDSADSAWAASHKSCETIHEAALAAAEWLEVCAENGVLAIVRLYPRDKPKAKSNDND